MTKVDFQVLCFHRRSSKSLLLKSSHVLCLQVDGSRKISEVQVRVCYYWQRLFSFTQVQVKFVLEDVVF